jgi:hypothetical protein
MEKKTKNPGIEPVSTGKIDGITVQPEIIRTEA